MGKSMYSLILTDEVVRAVDRVAGQQGFSRSAMINRILADYLSMPTQEQMIRRILDCAASAAARDGSMRLQSPPSDSMMSMRGAIRTKYNPAIRYSVELTPAGDGYRGELRVQSRTQSEALLERLSAFFRLWTQVERLASRDAAAEFGGGRYRRRLEVEQNGAQPETELLGEAIGGYLRVFDRSMDLFFEEAVPAEQALAEIRRLYSDYLSNSDLIL